jgi:hypothetical protein
MRFLQEANLAGHFLSCAARLIGRYRSMTVARRPSTSCRRTHVPTGSASGTMPARNRRSDRLRRGSTSPHTRRECQMDGTRSRQRSSVLELMPSRLETRRVHTPAVAIVRSVGRHRS